MQVDIQQTAKNAHFLLLYWPSLNTGNMINYTQIATISANAGRLASLDIISNTIHTTFFLVTGYYPISTCKQYRNSEKNGA